MLRASGGLGGWAKEKLEEFVPLINRRMADFLDSEIKMQFGMSAKQKAVVEEMLQLSREYVLRPQKRLRSSFVYYGYKLGGGEVTDSVWDAAMAMDLIQAGLLMQDDFMDKDEKRRGKQTMHRIYSTKFGDGHLGDSMAVTIGDVMLFMGTELVGRTGNREAMIQTCRGIVNTGYGQAYDLTLEALKDWTEGDVVALHAAKTAVYTYENPLVVGAYLAGLKIEVIEKLRGFARNGGIAFQLQDDSLGVFGTPEKTGKSADSDLKQGKCTLLVLRAIDRPEVKKAWGNEKASDEQLEAAKKAIKESGAYEYNKNLAIEYASEAIKAARDLRKLGLEREAVDYLEGIAQYMVEREV